jgi:hypothetical protein
MVEPIIRTDKYESVTRFTIGYGYDQLGKACVCFTLNDKLYILSPQCSLDMEAGLKEHNMMFRQGDNNGISQSSKKV